MTEAMLNERIGSLVTHWDTSINWSEKELFPVVFKLKQIALLNQARVYFDQPMENEDFVNYFSDCIKSGLEKALRIYIKTVSSEMPLNKYSIPVENNPTNPTFNFVERKIYTQKIDINLADGKQLETLPGIGETIAGRIITYRKKTGYFKNIDELVLIKGISEKMLEEFKFMISVENNYDTYFYVPLSLKRFINNPSFPNYIKVIKETNGVFFSKRNPDTVQTKNGEKRDIKNIINSEVSKCLKILQRNRFNTNIHGINSSRVNEYSKARKLSSMLVGKSATDINGVSLLDDIQYLYFLREAIPKAKRRIYVAMFFMRFEEEKKYPINEFIDLLVDANKRGVVVNIILDKDAEGDVYNSRIINKEAYTYFKKNKVKVVHDSELYVTHSKLVVIDDVHTIIGSHNWTAGSFFVYDDKSLYVESKNFNDQVARYFEKLWGIYHGKFPVSDLRSISSSLKAKLENLKIIYTKDLLAKLATQKSREDIGKTLEIDHQRVLVLANILDLMRVEGIQEEMAYLLERVGVDSPLELSIRNSDNLYNKIKSYRLSYRDKLILERKPTQKQLSYWIKKSKRLKQIIFH